MEWSLCLGFRIVSELYLIQVRKLIWQPCQKKIPKQKYPLMALGMNQRSMDPNSKGWVSSERQ